MADMTSASSASEGTAQTAQSPQPTSTQTNAPQSTTSSAGSTTQSTPAQQATEKKPNLFESEEFRKYQSQQEKRFQTERQQFQQQMARMQQEMQQFRLQSAPEEERVAVERDMLRQQLAQFQQEQQRQAMLSQQYGDIQRLAEYSGMKAEDLWQQNFSNIGDAAFYAMEHMTKRQKAEFEKAVDAEIERRAKQREANATDLGGGAPVTTDSLKEKSYKDALKRKDGKAFVLQYLQGE